MMPHTLIQPRWHIDKNPYPNLYVDLTERCNMDCNFCYNPERSKSDLDFDYFAEACARLPNPVHWRFLGGEPTLNKHFFDLIEVALKYGHTVYFASNGYKYNDPSFMEKLALWSGKVSAGLSMDGGTLDNHFYDLLNNRSCMDIKLQALENLHRYGIKRVCLSAIIVRNENERVIAELYEAAKRYSDVVRYIHYRSAAMVGRWVDTQPYALEELKQLTIPLFSDEEFSPRCLREINCNDGDGECCYRFRPNPRLQISLIEFASARSSQCPNRGKLLQEDFLIEPFFANMIDKSADFSIKHGEVKIPISIRPPVKTSA